MTAGAWIVLIIVALLVVALLLLRFNTLWVFKVYDRALKNPRDKVTPEYERPRYYTCDSRGNVDTSARWPGWDGWYFFVLPDDENGPSEMIRGSLMTGLYGLGGIDDYEKLLTRLSSFEAAEHLCLVPTRKQVNGSVERRTFLSQHYEPKVSALSMAHDKLDIAVTGCGSAGDWGPREAPTASRPIVGAASPRRPPGPPGATIANDERRQPLGRIQGAWPDYRMQCVHPEAAISLDAAYRGERLLWWADMPGVFTYFAAFGSYEGQITYHRGVATDDPHRIGGEEQTYPVKGRGCFEHGFARRPFDFDRPWAPARLITRLLATRTIRYHYELFIGEDGLEGGFMRATGFGIPFRNHGGIYSGQDYTPVKSVRISYVDDPPPDEVDMHCLGRPRARFYRRWKVIARTAEGPLEYVATRQWPPATIAPHMMYYSYVFEGTWKGRPIRGRGYGEYLHM